MKKRKTFKGMTLIEIIISLAVLSVMTLILVQTSNAINMYIKSANRVNQKTVQQAPIAEIGHKSGGELVAAGVEINVNDGQYDEDGNLSGQTFNQSLKGNAYKAGDSAASNELGGNLNMQYIVDLETVTTATAAPGP